MQHDRPDFPTMEQVEKANHEQFARWYRFLPSGDSKEQQKIIDRIAERFKRFGGMTSNFGTCEVKNWLVVLNTWVFAGRNGLIKG
jgi:hypothetical protein